MDNKRSLFGIALPMAQPRYTEIKARRKFLCYGCNTVHAVFLTFTCVKNNGGIIINVSQSIYVTAVFQTIEPALYYFHRRIWVRYFPKRE